MTTAARRKVAFYAPIKPPDHPVPSGDREMGRLLWRALESAGFAPVLASRLSTLNLPGDVQITRGATEHAIDETARLLALYEKIPEERPCLWFTYHLHYKAPDLIGPAIAHRLGIPYVVAEGSRAPKRAHGAWAEGHRQAEAALDMADIVFVLNPNDRPMLEAARPERQRLVGLPPFIDPAEWPEPPARFPQGDPPLRLLTVAMMRAGDKLASYTVLATALDRLEPGSWTLDIVGDGPARAEVEALFAPFLESRRGVPGVAGGPRKGDPEGGGKRDFPGSLPLAAFGRERHRIYPVRFHGVIEDKAELARLYQSSSVLVWPAVNEAFGMVFLEAGLQGCPSVAGDFGGVGEMVRDGETGFLTPPGDTGTFAAAMERFAADAKLSAQLGAEARRFALRHRSISSASTLLERELGYSIAEHEAARP